MCMHGCWLSTLTLVLRLSPCVLSASERLLNSFLNEKTESIAFDFMKIASTMSGVNDRTNCLTGVAVSDVVR